MYEVHTISFQTFFVWAFKIVVDSWKFSMLLLYILWDDWTVFYDFKFKLTATAGNGIRPTEAWLSQMVNFKNAIWTWGHFRTICNRNLFLTWKKCHRNGWNTSDCFGPSCMNRASVFEWHKRFKEGCGFVRDDERYETSKEVNTPELIG